MRVPSPEPFKRWLSGIGLFLSGMVIGSAVYMSVHQTNFSLLVERNTVLQDENDNLKKEIQNLNKFKNSQSVIKKITVRYESSPSSPLDPVIEQELKQQVMKKLEPVYEGQSMSLFVSGSENGRQAEIRKLQEIVSDQYTVKEHVFKVEATGVAVIQTELIVYIKSKPSSAADSFLFR
ncbi:hypothetical protein FE784_40315 [Paenibacillus hemerocallicola]|uniref:Sporulation protein n=1 Tax=Paenibacillus hemerocallicola TaxID=1172614 RepID=A0A5C4SUT0_9BACL|nr:hypothetical protein [Paenibacillus hemerocallicola]TNJ53705.1 hypothetical protein FE784_40315 [Paenibacillus hemerocallicola]